MTGKITVSAEEREKMVRGEREDFPKYTTQFLNLANQNAQSTRAEYVGNMKDILQEFENNHPEGTYDEWVEFYEEKYDGQENLESSANRLYEMVVQMREAIEKIDRDMAFRYVRQLVLYKSYMGEDLDVEEVILKKISQIYAEEVTRKPDSWVSAYVGDVPIVLQSQESDTQEDPGDQVATIYYKTGPKNSLEIDPYELNQRLGTTISDNKAHRRLDDFSFSVI